MTRLREDVIGKEFPVRLPLFIQAPSPCRLSLVIQIPREVLHRFESELRRCSSAEDVAPASFLQTIAKEVGVAPKSYSYALQYAHDLGLVIFPKLLGKVPKVSGTLSSLKPRNVLIIFSSTC